MDELILTEKKDLRDKAIERTEILDKVKNLMLLPELDMMTARQIADYYEVDYNAIRVCYQRNKNEIDEDGSVEKSLQSLKAHFVPLKIEHGKCTFKLSDNIVFEVPNRGIRCFSKRAVLRFGMLLRDSVVAKEVRTQLLNVFEISSDENKTKYIDEERSLFEELGKAILSGDFEEESRVKTKIISFKNRHIDKLTELNNNLKNDNQMLASEILRWNDRAALNHGVRIIAKSAEKWFGSLWNELYNELRYKHNIGLSQRGKPPYIQYIKETEWPKVQQSFCAICEKYGLSPSSVLEKAKMNIDSK